MLLVDLRERFSININHNSLRSLRNITEPSGGLAPWRLRISEIDYDTRYVKDIKHPLADCKSRIPTTADATAEMDQDTPCFLAGPAGFEDDPKNDESIPVGPRVMVSIFQLKLPPNFTSSASTHNRLVREQSLDKFCREMHLTLEKGGKCDGNRTRKHLFLENEEILCRGAHIYGGVQYLVSASVEERLLYVSYHPKTTGRLG